VSEPSNAKIYRNVHAWGFLIVAAQFGILATVAEGLATAVLAGVATVFCVTVSNAYTKDGYSRRFWQSIGLKVPEVGSHE